MISEEQVQRISDAVTEIAEELGEDPMAFLALAPEEIRGRFGIVRRRERALAEVERQLERRGIEHLPRQLPTNTHGLVVLFSSVSAIAEHLRTKDDCESGDSNTSQNGDQR